MGLTCFWEKGLSWETLAHRKQRPALSYAKGKVSGILRLVMLGAKKFFLLLVFLLFGMVKTSAQTRIKNTKNRVSKSVRRIGIVMSGGNVNDRQSIDKRDTLIMVRIDTLYLPKSESMEIGAASFFGLTKKSLPLELMRLLIEGIIFHSLILIRKKLKLYFYLLRRWRRRKYYKKSFL